MQSNININFIENIQPLFSFAFKDTKNSSYIFSKKNFYPPLNIPNLQNHERLLQKIEEIHIDKLNLKMYIYYEDNSYDFLNISGGHYEWRGIKFVYDSNHILEYDGLWKVKSDFDFLEIYRENIGNTNSSELNFLESDDFKFCQGDLIALEIKDNDNFVRVRSQIIRNIMGLHLSGEFTDIRVKFIVIMAGKIYPLDEKEVIEMKNYVTQIFPKFELIVISLLSKDFFGIDTLTSYSESEKFQIFSKKRDEKLNHKLNAMEDKFKVIESELRSEISQVKTELKSEISQVKTELKSEISQAKTELRSEISEMKTESRSEISEMKTELKAEISEIKTKMSEMEKRMNEGFTMIKN